MSLESSHQPGTRNDPVHALFMQRCLQLAGLGTGYTAPNPLVGSILVHQGRIIGEGYHKLFGGPHAEVNCIQSVSNVNRPLIPSSTLYVSLEPCCHYGKTPPCTDLILREKIPRVVIGCRDPFPEVNGKGIEKLIAHGVLVEYPVLEDHSKEMNRRFFTFHEKKKPFVILKWAQSANHKMSGETGSRLKISNDYSNRLVHKWRTEEAGILIGTNTALTDNPQLTSRLWPGNNPVRMVADQNLRLPESLQIFDGSVPTVILNSKSEQKKGQLLFKKINDSGISSLLSGIYSLDILSVLVEGGAKLLQSFIDSGTWDELRIITNTVLTIPSGVSSPEFGNAQLIRTETWETDTIDYYRKI